MSKRLALVHTVVSLVPLFKALCAELLPAADVFNVVDESLLQNVIRDGRLAPATARRVAGHLLSAEAAGAEAVLVTCSSIGPAVEMARPLLSIPAYRVDEPMADRAVQLGRRIGVAATLRTTLEPTTALVAARAAAAGVPVQVIARLCDGAFEALSAGDTARHDALVAAGLRELFGQADVVVLAQASMARVADGLDETERPVPVLSSPRLAVEHLARLWTVPERGAAQ